MNTIKVLVLLAPLCGHQAFQQDCRMCVNLHLQTRELLKKVGELSRQTPKGVAVTIESYEDTSGDTTTTTGRK